MSVKVYKNLNELYNDATKNHETCKFLYDLLEQTHRNILLNNENFDDKNYENFYKFYKNKFEKLTKDIEFYKMQLQCFEAVNDYVKYVYENNQ